MTAAGAVEGIHADNVTAWFKQHIPGAQAPFSFELLAGGHSNLTFSVSGADGAQYVLRRPPLGHVLESAHDMGREHKIISALAGSAVPVAPALGMCRDVTVNEAPFYVMQYVPGWVLHDVEASAQLSPAQRGELSLHVVDVLAALHAINPDDVGLGDLGRKEAYLERQLKRWSKQWLASKTHEIPAMDETLTLLSDRMPEQIGATIVHGDYRVGNMIVLDGRIQAVLDWELCTLGDPLADLGYLLNWWVRPGEAEEDVAATACEGYAERDVLCERYAQATGRDLSHINYYRAFSHWRLAAISQGVYKRYLVGAMGDSHDLDLDVYKEGVSLRAQMALDLLTS